MKKKLPILSMVICLSMVVISQSAQKIPDIVDHLSDEEISIQTYEYVENQKFTDEVAVTLNIKVFLEGPYFNGQMTPFINVLGFLPTNQPYNISPWYYEGMDTVSAIPSFNIIDWILVELIKPDPEKNGSYSTISRKAGFVLNNGTITGLDGINNLTMQSTDSSGFYLRINHRNHLSIISSDSLIKNMGTYSWDYTCGAAQALGGEYSQNELIQGVWGMISGNGDANGQIDNCDKNEVWFIEQNSFGYFSGDYDMDSQVTDDDIIVKWKPNVGRGFN